MLDLNPILKNKVRMSLIISGRAFDFPPLNTSRAAAESEQMITSLGLVSSIKKSSIYLDVLLCLEWPASYLFPVEKQVQYSAWAAPIGRQLVCSATLTCSIPSLQAHWFRLNKNVLYLLPPSDSWSRHLAGKVRWPHLALPNTVTIT